MKKYWLIFLLLGLAGNKCFAMEEETEPGKALSVSEIGEIKKKLIAQGAVLDNYMDDEIDYDLLHHAALVGDEESARRLIESGTSVEVTTGHKNTPLHLAAIKGHENVARLLVVEKKAQIDPEDYLGYTPLRDAASRGHKNVVQLLTEHNANINAKGEYGGTPLDSAAANGHEDVVRFLMEKGAPVSFKDIIFGKVPFYCAKYYLARLLQQVFYSDPKGK